MYKYLILLFAFSLFAEIDLSVLEDGDNCKVQIINKTNQELPVNGYRLIAPDTSWDSISSNFELYISYYQDSLISKYFAGEYYFHQVNFKFPYQTIMAPGDTIEITYHYSNSFTPLYPFGKGGMLDGELSPVILKSLINHYKEILFERDVSQELSAVIGNINYYKTDLRYHDICGNDIGGLFDDFKNKTQILLPVSDSTCRVSMTDVTFSPYNADVMYLMTLAMGQEYFGLDMQYMIAMGMKETFAAVGPTDFYLENMSTGVHGPFQVESSTANSRMIAYKDLFYKTKSLINGYYNAVNSGNLVSNYFSGNSYPLSSPEIISAYIFSMVSNLYINEIFSNCTEFNWQNLIENTADSLLQVNAILACYNLGIFGGGYPIATKVRDDFNWCLNTSTASDAFPVGNANYRTDIVTAIKHLEKISGSTVNDTTLEIYDNDITLKNLEEFLFGKDGTAGIPAATGGLCQHLEFNNQDVWSAVTEAFNFLKGKAPSVLGKEVISYRYDFLTMLRIIDDHLDLDFKFYGDADALQFTEKYSTNFESKDLKPPLILYDGHTYYDSRYSYAYCRLFDNNALYALQYADNSNWLNIHNSDNPIYELSSEIYIQQDFDDFVSSENPAWFFVSDTSGNCTISKTEFSNTENIETYLQSNMKQPVIIINNDIIKLENLDGKITAKVFNLKGSMLGELNVSNNFKLNTKDFATGTYLLKLKSKSLNKAFKFNIIK